MSELEQIALVPILSSKQTFKIKPKTSQNYRIHIKPKNSIFIGTAGNPYQLELHCTRERCSLII